MAAVLQGVNTVSVTETRAGGRCGVDRLATVGGWQSGRASGTKSVWVRVGWGHSLGFRDLALEAAEP